MDWDWDKSEIPKGHTMPFMEALVTSLDGLIFRMTLPTWLINLTKRGRLALSGYHEMEVGHLSTFHPWPNLNSDYRDTW